MTSKLLLVFDQAFNARTNFFFGFSWIKSRRNVFNAQSQSVTPFCNVSSKLGQIKTLRRFFTRYVPRIKYRRFFTSGLITNAEDFLDLGSHVATKRSQSIVDLLTEGRIGFSEANDLLSNDRIISQRNQQRSILAGRELSRFACLFNNFLKRTSALLFGCELKQTLSRSLGVLFSSLIGRASKFDLTILIKEFVKDSRACFSFKSACATC